MSAWIPTRSAGGASPPRPDRPAARRVRGGAATGLLALALVGTPGAAAAHAIVLESVPVHDAVLDRAPARIFLRFNGRIERGLTRVTLGQADGRPVSLPVTAAGEGPEAAPDRLSVPLHPLPAGTYILRYKVLATDGHVTEGALRFTIREPR